MAPQFVIDVKATERCGRRQESANRSPVDRFVPQETSSSNRCLRCPCAQGFVRRGPRSEPDPGLLGTGSSCADIAHIAKRVPDLIEDASVERLARFGY
jgi:hypothetical protein